MTTGAVGTGGKRGQVSDADAASFQIMSPRLFGISYRLLGSAAEADDVVQDTWIRWQGADRTKVRDATAFLATTTTRLAINVAQSARARHESHIDPTILEPVTTKADPTLVAERREAIELAVRAVLEKLSPAERGAFVLREAFDYPYRQVSRVLGLSEANARQLVSRARTRLCDERRRAVSSAEQRRFLDAFLAAARTGSLATLEQLLVADVAASSRGNGVVDATPSSSRSLQCHIPRSRPVLAGA
jgi:RNA polymerase sigma factor (sigma-70 family)